MDDIYHTHEIKMKDINKKIEEINIEKSHAYNDDIEKYIEN